MYFRSGGICWAGVLRSFISICSNVAGILVGGKELVAGTEVATEEEIGLLDVVGVIVLTAGVVLKGAVLEVGVLVALAEVAGEPAVVVATVELENVTGLVGSPVDVGVGVPAAPHAGKTERMVAPPTATPALLRNSLRVSGSFRCVFLRILLSLADITISFPSFQFLVCRPKPSNILV